MEAATIVVSGLINLILPLAFGITDILLQEQGPDEIPTVDSFSCRENYGNFLLVRGAVFLSFPTFAFLALLLGLVFLCLNAKAISRFLLTLFVIVSLAGSLIIFGWNIYGLVITYRPNGLECSSGFSTAWLYINVTSWILTPFLFGTFATFVISGEKKLPP